MVTTASVTITGRYTRYDGTPATGTVTIRPNVSPPVVRDTENRVVLAGAVVTRLDGAGAFTVEVPATDDTNLDPHGFTYTATADLDHLGRTEEVPAVHFEAPAAAVSLDLSTVSHKIRASPVYAQPATGAEVATITRLAGDAARLAGDAARVVDEVAATVDGVAGELPGLRQTVDETAGELAGRLSEVALTAKIGAAVESAVAPAAGTYGTKPITNLGPDPRVTTLSGGAWYAAGSGTGGASTITRAEAGGWRGAPAAVQTFTTAPSGGGGGVAYGKNNTTGTGRIPVTPGRTYTVSLYACPSVALDMLARIVWLGSTGPTYPVLSAADGQTFPVLAGEHRRLLVTATAPADAAYMTVQARSANLAGIGTGTIAVSCPTISEGPVAVQHVTGTEPGAFTLGTPGDSGVVGPPEALRLAHWGDSIAAGGGAVDSPSALLGSRFGAPAHNGGVSGESAAQIRARQTADTATRDWVQIIGAGHNGASGASSPASVVTDIGAMVSHLTGPRRFLIMELIPWANHSAAQRANYDAVIAATRAAFPGNFVPVATWLRSQAAATAMGITFTPDDLSDVAAGHTPRVFRTDDIHLNLLGRRAYSYRIALDLAVRGWAQAPGGTVLPV